MPWFKVSDDWATHPKTISATKTARSLWFTSGTLMAKASTDGLIAADQHRLYAALAEVPWKSNAGKLVEVRFWHTHEGVRSCTDCQIDLDNINHHRRENDLPRLVVGPQDLYWHAWAFHQLPKHRQLSPEAKAADDRNRALRRDAGLCQEIQKRDGSLCRYCGFRVDWRHRKGRHRATYDHTDPRCFSPNGGNFLEGVVTACGECNEQKNARTVAEWVADGGRTLKPAGWKAGDPDPTAPDAIWPGSDPDLTGIKPESGHGSDPGREHGRADAPLGPGQVGSDPGPDPGQVGSDPGPDPGQVGSDPGPDPGQVGSDPGPDPGQVGSDPGPDPGQVGPVRIGLGGAGAGPGLAGLVRSGTGPSPSPDVSSTTTSTGADQGPATGASHPSIHGGPS